MGARKRIVPIGDRLRIAKRREAMSIAAEKHVTLYRAYALLDMRLRLGLQQKGALNMAPPEGGAF